MTTLLDYKTTLAYLAYLGYAGEPRTGALQVTRPRKTDRRKGKVTRNVFLAWIIGAAGSGKTSLLRSFAGKPYSDTYEPTSKMISVVNSVDTDGSEKYLVVSTRIWLRRMPLTRFASFKNLDQDTKPRCCVIRRRQTWSMLSSMSTIRVILIPSRI